MAESVNRVYQEEEAEQILRLAASLSPSIGTIDRDRLLTTAAELGITPEAVEEAERQIADMRVEQAYREEFALRARREFNIHFVTFLVMNGFFFLMNVATGLHVIWFIYISLCWGIGLAFHSLMTFHSSGSMYQDAYDRWRDKNGAVNSNHGLEANNGKRLADHSPSVVIGVHVGKNRG